MTTRKGKLQIKGFIAGFLVCAMLSGAVLAVANTGGVMREVFYGVNVMVNGVPQNFPADMTPFISGGRTFLPVRGIADVFGVPVEWDGSTFTVHIGQSPIGFPLLQTAPWYEHNNIRTRNLVMRGETYYNVIRRSAGGGTSWSHHNLNGQFTTLTGTLLREDDSARFETRYIRFIGDGRELAAFSMDGNSMPTEISVDVTGVLTLRIQIEDRHIRGATIGLYNAMLH